MLLTRLILGDVSQVLLEHDVSAVVIVCDMSVANTGM